MEEVWRWLNLVCDLEGEFFLSILSVSQSCFLLLEQAEIVAVYLADKFMSFQVGGVLTLLQLFDVFPGIPGREYKGKVAVKFIIVFGDQVTGEQDIDFRIKEIFFAESA